MDIDIIQDLTTLTTIPKSNFINISNRIIDCIAHTIYVGTTVDETSYTVDVGIGTLEITIKPEQVHYKFIPSACLTDKINSALDGEDKLAKELEEKLTNKILKTYKDI